MADADNRLVLDTTGNAILASLNVQNGLLAQMVRNNAVSTEVSWDEVKHIAKSGQADKAFSVGDQLVVKLTDGSNVYDDPWDVTGFANVRNKVGDVVPAMFLQQHYTLPFATSFDAREAFYVAGESGLPAGIYNVTLGYSQGTMVKGKTYQFTLSDPLVKGNQLLGFYGAWDTKVTDWKVYVFDSASAATPKATLAVAEGSAGTSLGTLDKPKSGDLWSIQCAAYGNGDWEHSNLRQWLNSRDANWFKPKHDYDHIPSASVCYGPYDSRAGFMSMLPEDFVAAVGEIEVVTARSYITYGGTSDAPALSKTFDKFFLPSLEQHWINCNESSVNGVEGDPWEYWKLARGGTSKAPLWQKEPAYIQYALNAKTAAQYSWVRSASRAGACTPFVVRADGYVGTNYACSGSRAAPACAIC